MCLFESLPCLHGHGSVDACLRELNSQIFGQEITAQRRHLVVDPVVFGGGVAPEMVMRVDDLLVWLVRAHRGNSIRFGAFGLPVQLTKGGRLSIHDGIGNGRGERIRTSDPLVPNQVRYQTALRPEQMLR